MKKISLILLVALTLGFVGCDSYEDFDADRPLVVGFTNASGGQNENYDPGEEEVKTVTVYVSEVSSEDRTFGVSIDTDQTEASADNYSLSSNSVTVLAGESTGTFESITLRNASLPAAAEGEDAEVFRVVLQIDRSDDYTSGNMIFTIESSI
ncbi:hypothetical protein SCB49_09460 [unidentified eubacterium SCB49]|nr:hypothetical protein SCB49_09460 [unidentified eubacterium SCB49]